MKKFLLVLMCFCLLMPIFGCDSALKKSDELAVPFIEALLLRDEAQMKNYIHPDYTETALPDDEFYQRLTDNHFFKVGNKLTHLTAMDKQTVKDESVEGDLLKCNYIIVCSEVYYDVNLVILDNDKGYGVIAVSMNLNTNPELYR